MKLGQSLSQTTCNKDGKADLRKLSFCAKINKKSIDCTKARSFYRHLHQVYMLDLMTKIRNKSIKNGRGFAAHNWERLAIEMA